MSNVDLSSAPMLEPGDVPLPPESPDEVRAKERARVAELQFLDPASISKTFPLDFPFLHEGREVREIVVRRLAVAEIGAMFQAPDTPELYDFYAAMTGLPKEVLRALRDEDVIFEGCAPFLPRIARKLFFAQTPETGGATPSP